MMQIVLMLLFLTAVLVAAHWALRFPWVWNSIKLWTIVEYVWLGAATIGLVYAAIELNRLDMLDQISTKEAALRSAYNEARMTVHGGDILIWGEEKSHDKGTADIRVAGWYRFIGKALDAGIESDSWRDFLAQNADLEFGPPTQGHSRVPQFPTIGWQRLDPITDYPFVGDHARLVLFRLRELLRTRHELSNIKAMAVPTNWERVLRQLWPWFFCIALGMRITKIRADILRSALEGTVQSHESNSDANIEKDYKLV